MSYHYWQGELIQLRAVEAQDIVFFECLDDEVVSEIDDYAH